MDSVFKAFILLKRYRVEFEQFFKNSLKKSRLNRKFE